MNDAQPAHDPSERNNDATSDAHGSGGMTYTRFGLMIATSTVLMYVLKYFNTYTWDHVYWSETRLFMALMMASMMSTVMLGFMLGMYRDRRKNIGIFAASALLFAISLFLLRSQTTVQDVSWMRSMIPHHSIAILVSERAEISDPRVRELADGIIETQREEIAEMKRLLADLTGEATDGANGSASPKADSQADRPEGEPPG